MDSGPFDQFRMAFGDALTVDHSDNIDCVLAMNVAYILLQAPTKILDRLVKSSLDRKPSKRSRR